MADIKDAEIHGIQEGIQELLDHKVPLGKICLCVDNQNTLRALSGRLTSSREHLRKCLKVLEVLQQRGYEISGKWTPSHQGIYGNEQADAWTAKGREDGKMQRHPRHTEVDQGPYPQIPLRTMQRIGRGPQTLRNNSEHATQLRSTYRLITMPSHNPRPQPPQSGPTHMTLQLYASNKQTHHARVPPMGQGTTHHHARRSTNMGKDHRKGHGQTNHIGIHVAHRHDEEAKDYDRHDGLTQCGHGARNVYISGTKKNILVTLAVEAFSLFPGGAEQLGTCKRRRRQMGAG